MKRKLLLIMLAVLMISTGSIYAAYNNHIERIKTLYNEAGSLEKDSDSYHEVIMKSILPAVGLSKTCVRFVFSSRQTDAERDPYAMGYSLKKVIVEYNIAARENHHLEYLFSNSGKLLFGYHRTESAEGKSEKRFYFQNKRLIRLIVSEKKDVNRITDRGFKKADRKIASEMLKKAASYESFFKSLIKLEQVK